MKAGTTPSTIASQYHIPRSTISQIRNVSGLKIETFLVANPHFDTRKTMKSAAYPKLDEALKVFFDQQRSLGKPISGTLLQEKARILHNKLTAQSEGGEADRFALEKDKSKDVKLGEGFLGKFKKRHGIRHMRSVGEKGSADKKSIDSFIQNFQDIILTENLTHDQVYNADETGLCWRAIPTKNSQGLMS